MFASLGSGVGTSAGIKTEPINRIWLSEGKGSGDLKGPGVCTGPGAGPIVDDGKYQLKF